MANSFTFGEAYLGDEDYGVTILTSNWNLIAPPRIDVAQVSFASGIAQKSGTGVKDFSLPILIQGTSASDLYTKLDNIAAAFTQSEDCILYFDDFVPDRFWLGRYSGGLESLAYAGLTAMQGTISFTSPYSHAFSLPETIVEIEVDSNPITFDVVDDETSVIGNWYAEPIYIIDAVNGASSISLTNNSTGESLSYSAALANGELLQIDSMGQVVSKNAGAGFTISMIPVSGRFPRLKGGMVNSLTLTGVASGGTLEITYRGRFI